MNDLLNLNTAYQRARLLMADGMCIAVLLMVVGVTMFSFATANIVAFLVGSETEREESTKLSDVMAKLQHIEEQLELLRHEHTGQSESADESQTERAS